MRVPVSILLFILASCQSAIVTQSPTEEENMKRSAKNVLGGELLSCCTDPLTGFYRDGHCYTGADDYGTHIVCARVSEDFLGFSVSCGNDLVTPLPAYHFPGLQPGDYWCLCVTRWVEAYKAGVAPPINLEATHEKALEYVSIEVLLSYAVEKQN